jgi:hypothetical protein
MEIWGWVIGIYFINRLVVEKIWDCEWKNEILRWKR